MSLDFSMSAISPLTPLDVSPALNLSGGSEEAKIKQVSKALEGVFVSQLTAELGKGIEDTDDTEGTEEDKSPYSDFIQQAMTAGVTQGGGFGLAKLIENYLTHRNQETPVHPAATFSAHAKSAD
jgi:Rod binding domain-containing protein